MTPLLFFALGMASFALAQLLTAIIAAAWEHRRDSRASRRWIEHMREGEKRYWKQQAEDTARQIQRWLKEGK